MFEHAGEALPFTLREVAQLILALGAGLDLEHAADPHALPSPRLVEELITGLFVPRTRDHPRRHEEEER